MFTTYQPLPPRGVNDRKGRIARVGYPAAFGVKRSIERQLRKTDDRLVVADWVMSPKTASEHSIAK